LPAEGWRVLAPTLGTKARREFANPEGVGYYGHQYCNVMWNGIITA
jgi:hypothetical protein